MYRKTAGFSLVELLLVVVLGFIILGAVYETLNTQQQAYRQQTAVIETHEATRAALEVLAGELREISSSGADILMATRDSVTIRALRKVGFVCYVAGGFIDVWTLSTDFAARDRLLVYDNGGTTQNPSDDQWRQMTVTGADKSLFNLAACTQWPEYSLRGDSVGDHTRQHLVVTGSWSGTIDRGAPVRSYESVTYGIQQVDGEWMLTRREGAGATVALVGPLAAPADSGLALSYYDADGAQMSYSTLPSNLTSVNSFKITVKGEYPRGDGTDIQRDLSIAIYLRNNDPQAMGW